MVGTNTSLTWLQLTMDSPKTEFVSLHHLHKKHNINLAIGDRELDLIPAKELGISTCMFQGVVM